MDSNTPLISIIIPTYNRSKLIGQTLDSILSQTYENWECIIIDDQSTDNTKEIVSKFTYFDSRFRYYVRPSGYIKGVSSSRNVGMKIVKGDYINFFDSDDIMKPDFLQERLNIFLKQPYVDVVFCAYQCFNENGICNRIYNHSFSGDIIKDFLDLKTSFGPLSFLIKQNVVQDHFFSTNLHSSEDADFFFRLFTKKHLSIAHTKKVLYLVRRHNNSIVTKLDSKGTSLNSILTVNNSILDYCIENSNLNGVKHYKIRSLDIYKQLLEKRHYYIANKQLWSLSGFSLYIKIKLFLILIIFIFFKKGSYRIKKFY